MSETTDVSEPSVTPSVNVGEDKAGASPVISKDHVKIDASVVAAVIEKRRKVKGKLRMNENKTRIGNRRIPKNVAAIPTTNGSLNSIEQQARWKFVANRLIAAEKLMSKVPFAEEEPEKTFRMGTILEENHKEDLIRLIRKYKDIFAWGPDDMPGINTSIALDKLHVDYMYVPISKRSEPLLMKRIKQL
ncbi:hypothetical protein LIER_10052 [Lithospermum erythrorhizon]|uniref:Uncharacterized protein n=1 Tax=Lithospermum erythrorhizon TaxID=34254 RepID=A0AAV3PK83_LITER